MGLEDVGGHLSAVADVMLDPSGSEVLSWRVPMEKFLPILQYLHQLLKGLHDGQFSFFS